MKQLLSLLSILVFSFSAVSQTGAGDALYESNLSSSWTVANASQVQLALFPPLLVSCSNASVKWNGFSFNFSPIDVSAAPYVSLRVESGSAFNLRIDMIDINGLSTNQTPVIRNVTSDGTKYYDYFFDFTGKFFTQGGSAVNATKISSIIFMTNAGSGFTGNFFMDSVMVGSMARTNLINFPKVIKLNQLGFFTKGYKKAVVASGIKPASNYYIVSSSNITDTVFRGALNKSANWTYSEENVQIADFTAFKTPGRYVMLVPGITNSYPFTISDYALNPASKSTLRGYYYQRASIPISEPYAQGFSRAEGHPDTHVEIHPSAASYGRPTGTFISSPQGWYDAGDYNKYVVNAGISTYTLLSAYEHYSSYYDTLNLNIPESGNGIPDILDEALWEIRWLLTMQDPYDGGVYHKLTELNFDNISDVMPSQATSQRYVVQKSAQASFDFAAIMAQSARIFSNFKTQLPGFDSICINAAAKAYFWGDTCSTVYYNQTQLNLNYPSLTVNTGTYSDYNSSDEKYWAASELYATTQLLKYYQPYNNNTSLLNSTDIPGWPNVATLGLITLNHYRKQLPAIAYDTANIIKRINSIASKYKTYCLNSSAYDVAMGTNGGNDFNWGSNSTAGNQSFLMLEGFNNTNDSTYLNAALSNIDYLLGRNAPGICFVTGLGSNSTMHPHHGVSDSDGLPNPVPGLIAGGANGSPDLTEGCGSSGDPSVYPYGATLPAFTYLDQICSYSTNEIAINWNAPIAYCTGALQSIYAGTVAIANPYSRLTPLPTGVINKTNTTFNLTVFPNPSSSVLYADKPFDLISAPVVTDINGSNYSVTGDWSSDKITINTSGLAPGMYLIILQGANSSAVQKFTVIR